jgi:hypothetical protein
LATDTPIETNWFKRLRFGLIGLGIFPTRLGSSIIRSGSFDALLNTIVLTSILGESHHRLAVTSWLHEFACGAKSLRTNDIMNKDEVGGKGLTEWLPLVGRRQAKLCEGSSFFDYDRKPPGKQSSHYRHRKSRTRPRK